MEGKKIESHILDNPPSFESNTSTPNDHYLSKKNDDTLMKSWIFDTLTEEALHLVSGLSTSKEV